MAEKNVSLNKMIRSSFWAYLGVFIALFFSLITTVVLARLLDKENWGILSTIIAVVSFLSSISELGLNYYIMYVSSKYDKNSLKLKQKLASPLKWKFIIVFFIAFLMFLFSKELALLFNIKDGEKYFLIGSLYFFVFNIFSVFTAIFNGIKLFKEDSLISSSNQVLRLLFSAGLVLLGFGIDGALIGYLISIVIATSIQLFILRNIISFYGKDEESFSEIFTFSFFYGITSIAGTFTMWTDSVMLGFLVGTTSVGIYRIAVSLASSSSSLLNTINRVTFPYFTTDESKGKDSFENLNKVIKYVLFISFPAMVGIALLSDAIVSLFFGLQYIEASIPLIILSYFIFDGTVTGLINSYLGAKKLIKQIGISAVLAAILNIFLNVLLIPLLGIIGAAIASIFSRAMGLIFMVKWSEKILNLKFKFDFIIPFLSSVSMGIIIILFRTFIDPSSSFITLFFFVFLGMFVYFLAAHLLGFNIYKFINKVIRSILPKNILNIYNRYISE